MINHKGIIINAPDYLRARHRISPFKEAHISQNQRRYKNTSSGNIFNYFDKLFPEKSAQLTMDGRNAIRYALEILDLKKSDCVTIITTTNNFYISSCVTQEIEKKCKWSRELNSETRVIFINHEFGLFHADVEKYKKLGIPIIEDFAHSFCSLPDSSASGIQGDFLVCSFSKIFPMQAGGALLIDKKYNIKKEGDEKILNYVDANASFYIETINEIKNKRLKNYEYFSRKFQSIGIMPFFDFPKMGVPGVFCFEIQENINLSEFKEFMNANGIESSVFYGKNAYFVPCHQSMNEEDIDYIFEVIVYYLEK